VNSTDEWAADVAVAGQPSIRGREAELSMVDEVTRRLAAGQGSIVVWLGEPGMGKSSLLRAATDRIQTAVEDVQTVHVSGRGVRAGPLSAIALAIHQVLPSVPPMRSELLDRLLRPGADEDPEPNELLRAAVQVLRVASQRRPILITLDDVGLARDGNWAAVSAAAAQVAAVRVAVLVTDDGQAGRQMPLTSIGPLWVRRLEPLAADACVRLVRDVAAQVVPRSVAARLGHDQRGNPAAVRELSSVLSRDELMGLNPLPVPLPASQSTLEKYRRWLRSLTPGQFTLLLGAALALRPRATVLEAISDVEIADVRTPSGEAWAVLRHDTVEFVDPRLPAAILRLASHREVTRTQALLAEAFAIEDSLAATWHKAEVGEPLDDEAIAVMTGAAEAELDAGNFEMALKVASKALEVFPHDHPARAELSLIAGTAAYHGSYVGLAATLLHEAVGSAGDAETRYRSLVALCLAVAARDGSAPYALVETGLVQLAKERPSEAASLACLAARIASDWQQRDLAREYLERAESLAKFAAAPRALLDGADATISRERLAVELAHTRWWVRSSQQFAPGSLDGVAMVTTSPSPRDLVGWDLAVRHVALLTRTEEWQEARFALAELEHRQQRLASRMVGAATAVVALQLHLAIGAVQEAVDLVGTVVDDLPIRLPFAGLGLSLVARTFTLSDRGQAAREWLEQARRTAQSTGSPVVHVGIPTELAFLAMMRDDPKGAARQLEVAVQRATHFGHHAFALLQLDLLEARHAAGFDTRSNEVMPVLEDAWGGPAATSTQRTLLSAARLLAAPPDKVLAAALAAVDAAEFQASPLWAARVTFLAARVLGTIEPAAHQAQVRRLAMSDVPPERDEHRRLLYEKARAQFLDCGATAFVRLTELETGRLQLGAPAADSADARTAPVLTPEELRVATLVAEGASNRQVANAIYASVRTVELRLTSVYRKLGIRSRKELTEALATIETPQTRLAIVPNVPRATAR
jgi:DNA-binding CsgD family transcriptional regulator/tetratricopeptide (TPR) repeat protein